MRNFIVVLIVICGALWGYNIGHLDAPQPVTDHRIDNMHEIGCDDIVRDETSGGLICKIHMQAEDDNIIIFKGIGARDDE